METTLATRKLKIFCPTHQSVFEIEEKPQIICEIREHALSTDFPNAEFWEFCCDCQTFSPSRFGTGGKAKDACPHCERKTARRFLCDECKIIAYDSDEETKGKIHRIDEANGIESACPGCQKSFGGAKTQPHDCADIEGALLTSRKECPFCQKSVIAKPSAPPKKTEPVSTAGTMPTSNRQTGSTQCPKCGHWGIPERIHCGNCGTQINARAEGIKPGSFVPKTQLLGSICPNCGAGNQAGSIFCNSCGQALKVAPRIEKINDFNSQIFSAPPPAPTDFAVRQNADSAEQPTASYVASQSSTTKVLTYLLLGGGVLVVLLLGIASLNSNKSNTNTSNSANFNNSPTSSNNSQRMNSTPSVSNSNRYNSGSNSNFNSGSSPSERRTGRLERNVNLRSASNKYAEILGTHYEDAQVEILAEESYSTDEGYATWYKVRVLENGCDRIEGNGCGNNREKNGSFGWMEAEMEGWMNGKYIVLD